MLFLFFYKQTTELECSELLYIFLCLQFILSVYLAIYTNIQLFAFYHPQEIRSLYIQVYSVRYVNISWCIQPNTLLINWKGGRLRTSEVSYFSLFPCSMICLFSHEKCSNMFRYVCVCVKYEWKVRICLCFREICMKTMICLIVRETCLKMFRSNCICMKYVWKCLALTVFSWNMFENV